MESIFFATFRWDNLVGDRQQYNAKQVSLRDFFDWVQSERDKIEKKHNTTCIVENQKIIR